MNMTIQALGFAMTPAIESHARTRVEAAVGRYQASVRSVDVYLRDTNGPKGGEDKSALFLVRLRNGPTVGIESVHADLYAAIRVSAGRTRRAIKRTLKKHRRLAKARLRALRHQQPAAGLA